MFIVNPFSGRNAARQAAKLFSTHPPTEDRVERLSRLREKV
jgi:Zn-dependent protease with chaperone function